MGCRRRRDNAHSLYPSLSLCVPQSHRQKRGSIASSCPMIIRSRGAAQWRDRTDESLERTNERTDGQHSSKRRAAIDQASTNCSARRAACGSILRKTESPLLPPSLYPYCGYSSPLSSYASAANTAPVDPAAHGHARVYDGT